MDAETLSHVFEPFFTRQDQRRGTGLGLYITKRIIEAHGTKIWIESREGEGTTVHFCLPLAREASVPP